MVIALLLFLAASSFETSFREGLVALQRNDLAAAKSNLESAAQLAPENGKVWVALAQTYWKLNEAAQADVAATKASRLAPSDPTVQQSLAMFYFEAANTFLQREKFAEAVAILQKSPKSAQTELALGVAYYGLRRFDQAAAAFLATIELAPGVEQPYLFLGKMLDQIPDRLPAVTARFTEFEKANPSNYAGYLLHAKALDAQLIEPAAAEALLRKAIELNDEDPSEHLELGALLERTQRYPDAAREFERAAALDPSDPATHYRLSRVYERLGKHDAAKAERETHAKLIAAQDAAR